MQNNIRTVLAVELNEEISRKAGRKNGIIVNQLKDWKANGHLYNDRGKKDK